MMIDDSSLALVCSKYLRGTSQPAIAREFGLKGNSGIGLRIREFVRRWGDVPEEVLSGYGTWACHAGRADIAVALRNWAKSLDSPRS